MRNNTYFNCTSPEEKAVHILCAGKELGEYHLAYKECVSEFGESLTKKAEKICEKNFSSIFMRNN